MYKLTNDTCIAGYTTKPWTSPSSDTYVKDSSAVLLNLTRSLSFTTYDNKYGGIRCRDINGPTFGNGDLVAYPYGGREKELRSYVEGDGYKIPAKVGEINPLTGDKLFIKYGSCYSESTLKEIEVWEIMFLD